METFLMLQKGGGENSIKLLKTKLYKIKGFIKIIIVLTISKYYILQFSKQYKENYY